MWDQLTPVLPPEQVGRKDVMRPLESGDPLSIGQYRLLGVLGSGGMGRVYLGRTAGGRTVAVKVVRPDLRGDTEFRTRFRREVAAARRVAGRYTVPVLDADTDGHHPWLATGYVPGIPLTEAVAGYGPLAPEAVIALARGLARALTEIHAAGVIHRDLKPSNVLLAVDGPRVIDFGIARAADDSALTSTGQVIGSAGYMSPEQITGSAPIGPRADVFSLGGVLAYAATGAGPFGEGDSIAMMWRVVQEEPRLDGVAEPLRGVLADCLAKEPASRPTPDELTDRLAVLGAAPVSSWLPAPILQDLGRRTAALLDLEAVPIDAVSASARAAFPAMAPSAAATVPWQPGASGPSSAVVAPPPARSSSRRRIALVVTAAVAVLAVGGLGGGFLAFRAAHHDTPVIGTGTSTAAQASGTAAPSASAAITSSALPAGYVGTWTGTAGDGLVTFDIVVTLRSGAVGQELGTSSNTGEASRSRCERAETLTAVDSTGITLRARLTGGDTGPVIGCEDDGKPSTLKLDQDGSAAYTMTGPFGSLTGTLRKR